MKTSSNSPQDPPAAASRGAYRQFFLLAGLTGLALTALGFLPTRALAGDSALVAMGAAIAVAMAASGAGTVPVYFARLQPPQNTVGAQLGAMALRLMLVLALGASVALSGLVAVKPFLLWLVIAHAALLVADTLFARTMVLESVRRHEPAHS
ncbi:MAG: hypothetical protein AAGF23_23940 [Acidobacteriota bacterium]